MKGLTCRNGVIFSIFSLILLSANITRALDLQIASKKPQLNATEDVIISVTITNDEHQPVSILKWTIPGNTLEADYFEVTRDGQAVAYVGRHYKRAAAQHDDYVTLQPGEHISQSIELSTQFDLSVTGSYKFTYKPEIKDHDNSAFKGSEARGTPTRHSASTQIWIEGRNDTLTVDSDAQNQPFATATGTGGVSYAQNCSNSRRTAVDKAFRVSKYMVRNAIAYLREENLGDRYTTWFGDYSPARYATAKTHFISIIRAQKDQEIAFDCGCTESAFAYVYANAPYKIYLCNAFWSAPVRGTDSKAGTIVHELSHFNVVAATRDYAYGHFAAQQLARNQPDNALYNADNHEYFAENTPFQD